MPDLPAAFSTPSTASDYSADNMLALREHGRALGGPPAAELVPPVERCVLEAALGDYLQDLLERPARAGAAGAGPTDAKLAEWLLNASRCLYGIRTGRLITKTGAARRLSEEQPALAAAMQAALAVRAAPGCPLGEEGRAEISGAFAALAGSACRLPRPPAPPAASCR